MLLIEPEVDYADSVEVLTAAAERGDAAAQFQLGKMHEMGQGLQQSYLEAERLYKGAAQQQHPLAMVRLGTLYYKGLGVKQSFLNAGHWWHLAARQQCAAAQYCLGVLYEKGAGLRQDYKQAAIYYTLAAQQGQANAMVAKGVLFEKGLGVDQSYSKAFKWYEQAAGQGNAYGQFHLAKMYEQGRGVAKDCTKALYYFGQAFQGGQGHPEAEENYWRLSAAGCETPYSKALDSLGFYLRSASFTPLNSQNSIQLISYFQPHFYDSMEEVRSDKLFRSKCGSSKSKIILTDGNLLYILDLVSMDSTFLEKGRNHALRIADPAETVRFLHSAVARAFNGRSGRMEPEVLLYFPEQANKIALYDKLQHFFKLAVVEAKKELL